MTVTISCLTRMLHYCHWWIECHNLFSWCEFEYMQ